MAHLSNDQIQALGTLQKSLEHRLATDPGAKNAIDGLALYLVHSEQQLMALMEDTPPPEGGDIEFGAVLYWLDNDLPSELDWIAKLFPKSGISTTEWTSWEARWRGAGVVAPDGTLFGDGPFEQLDRGWLFSAVLYLIGEHTDWLPRAPFGNTPYCAGAGDGKDSLSVAVIGDWGSGVWNDCGTQGPAREIMDQIGELDPQPDLVIHVGDVYYSGTGRLGWKIDALMLLLGAEIGVTFDMSEEQTRLVSQWWAHGAECNSFTLNSNHEMYSAARGLFEVALVPGTPFAAQNQTSYFALTFKDWIILGLDSAYYSHSNLYMEGRLQDKTHTQQVDWMKSLPTQGKKVVVLTHHNGLTYDGLPVTSSDNGPTLWDDVKEGLNGRDPDYWYWGHIHNGIIYTDKASPVTKARCLGHAALPFGKAYYWEGDTKRDLDESPKVAFYSKTKKPNPNQCSQWDNRVLNGFTVFTLSEGSISEAVYEQGNPDPVWRSPEVTAEEV